MNIKHKEFKPTSWSVDNKTSIYVLAISIALFGLISFIRIPKEQFPDIVIPTILVSTIYPGTSPEDMENLVTRPIEKNLKSINGVKKITSNSVQDFSSIAVEFNPDIEVADAKQKVKDAVDKSKNDLPNNLLKDPDVIEIDLSEIPIMSINLSGDIKLDKLKHYADLGQDKIESFKEITRVDIIGALEREIKVDVDMYKAQAASVSFNDIDRAISSENITISGGTIDLQGMRRSLRVAGEFKNMDQLKNITLKSSSGALVMLKDIADIKDDFKEQESYARLDGKNVITLNVIKKTGQNLLVASDKIKESLKELQKTKYPSNLKITITGDQSRFTRSTLEDLNNTIIIGFILVTIVLMFFMGLTNAIFVGMSVPLSMALAYLVMPAIDFTMNMLVMFAFIFALGIVVDDAIVVIENTHRIFKKTKVDISTAAKHAAGEVFAPILSGTLTTLAPFFPLAFWPGTVGKFMYFIPVTLIITLFASLIVAYIINPVFAVTFMKHDDDGKIARKKVFRITGMLAGITILIYITGKFGIANLMSFVTISYLLHNFYGRKVLINFQKNVLPKLMDKYEKLIRFVLIGRRPYYLLYGLIGLLIISFIITGLAKPKVVFFPTGQPMYIYTYIKLPVGTDVKVTDSVTKIVENRIVNVLGKDNPIVESVIANVALGAGSNIFDRSTATNLGKVSVSFVEYSKRKGISTTAYLDKMREAVKGIPGAEITVDINQMGPPVGKPINVEITGEDLEDLVSTSNQFINYINSLRIPGIEQLKSDFDKNNPEINIDINRERANREGISTGQIGMEIRTAVLGKEVSKYRDGEDQFPIQLRYSENERKNIDGLLNLKITYRDMNSGLLRQIPLSSVAKIDYKNTYGGIKRKDLKRIITVYSNVLSGYTANEIVKQINEALPDFELKEGMEIKLTGEQENQQESSDFLGIAMLVALFLILFILITQFNSISKPAIIISEVIFSIIGVLLGFVIFGMNISIIMTGMGIVALAGIVVRNGILLVEFTDVLKEQGYRTREAIVHGGKTRITPVLLTATATILGLIPLALGFNINFETLFTDLNPHIYIGGDNAQFFGPLAWTIIFGLSFATFLTLVMIPVMYYIAYAGKMQLKRRTHKYKLMLHKE